MSEKSGRGAGRPPGARNRKTIEAQEKAREAAEKLNELIPGAFEGDAHAYLISVYKNPTYETPMRVDAAKAAIRYEKPALSTIDAKVEADIVASVQRIEIVGVKP